MHLADHVPVGTGLPDVFACRDAVSLKPKSALARLDLAYALLRDDDPAEALEQASKALALQPNLHAAARFLALLLQQYQLDEDIDVSRRGLQAAFEFLDIDRQAIGDAAIAYLKQRPPLKDVIARGRTENWEAAAQTLLKGNGRKLLQDRLLCAALSRCINTDIEVEFLLTALRKELLLTSEHLNSRAIYNFACVLIRHCFNNDYVFYVTETERERLATLEVDLDGLFDGERRTVSDCMQMALYEPVVEQAVKARKPKTADKIVPRALRMVFIEHIESCRIEREVSASITQLTPITDETSRMVAAQYQKAPYPRWHSLQAPEPGSARRHLETYFTVSQLDRLGDSLDILIAGAGTCRQAVHSALAYGPESNILAVDLSAASLAYGAHMAKILGAGNLRFATADILRLNEIDEQFDVVECAGVLHHMQDPYAAWKRLIGRLRPGGLMQIGLYSAVARREIEALPDDPSWPGSGASNDALRSYRHALMKRKADEAGATLTSSVDFYATGDFRDLALHVQEQRCSIPEIRDFMAQNGLDFHGFILPQRTHDAYHTMFPDDAARRMLDNWWEFELAYPRTFDGMYMFWCRRPDAGG